MRLGLIRERRLTFSLALRQAVEILQMPKLELATWLHQEIEKNPILELPEPKGFLAIDETASTPSLYEHLCREIKDAFSDRFEQKIAETIVGFLDEKGFLSTPLVEIAELFQCSLSKLETILKKIQSFDPPGIGARNIQECFLLQLEAKAPCIAKEIVERHFDDLLHGRYVKIKKKLQIDSRELTIAIEKLAKLNLRPASGFKELPAPAKIADLKATKVDGKWFIEILDEEFPPIQIRQDWSDLVPKLAAAEKKSIKTWLIAAKWLKRSLCRRNRLLIQLASELLNKQTEYLDKGGVLEPITTQDLAKSLEVHESTIHRTLTEKMIEGPWGVASLRSFLPLSATTNHHKKILEKLIEQENKTKPLTDEELSSLFKLKGVALARRTIAKYRKELKLGPASRRKLQK